ncbi:MAG: hypothetical protein KKI09_04865 [Spirochaetes bacterium]|nr:hypothetical protein [Spirochaetota bacterium]MBU0954743.1 hypothetical protein [Spirochaetota bacterium]
MTISSRRLLYHFFLAVSLILLLLALVLLFGTPAQQLENARFIVYESLTRLEFLAGLVMILFSLAVAVGGTAIMALGIGKSSSVEIFFFALWAASMSTEAGRMLNIWLSRQDPNMAVLILSTRFVLFGRYLGVASMFLASIFSVGFKAERMNPAALIASCLALLLASMQPLNSGSIDSQFLVIRGYTGLSLGFESAIVILTMINYLIAWNMSGSRHFLFGGAGAAAILAGLFLLRFDLPILIKPLAMASIIFGSWLYLRHMYQYYLWR